MPGERVQVEKIPQRTNQAVDSNNTSIQYIGIADPQALTSEPKWMIVRRTYTGNSFIEEYADGNSLYDNIWNNRESLTYS